MRSTLAPGQPAATSRWVTPEPQSTRILVLASWTRVAGPKRSVLTTGHPVPRTVSFMLQMRQGCCRTAAWSLAQALAARVHVPHDDGPASTSTPFVASGELCTIERNRSRFQCCRLTDRLTHLSTLHSALAHPCAFTFPLPSAAPQFLANQSRRNVLDVCLITFRINARVPK
jgi:hypothetical protein